MSFWNQSNGQEATGEIEENDFAPLPKNNYKCIVEEASIDTYQGKRKIKFKARVVGEGFGKNRVVFLNLKVFDEDAKKRDRAINLLVKWAQSLNAALPKGEPDDVWLSKLTDKPLTIKLDIFTITKDNGDIADGNFVVNFDSISAKVGDASATENKNATLKGMKVRGVNDLDPDVPF